MQATFTDLARLLAALMLGASFGAILTAAGLLVPYWQSLPPADFLTWFAANAKRMLGFFGPLQTTSVLVAVVAAVATTWTGHPSKSLAILAAALAITVLGLYPAYFQRANAAFETARISTAEVPAALAQWAYWQWIRTSLAGASFIAALLALRRAA